MTTPITLPSLEKPTLAELRRRYEEATDAETRTRYQMLFLSLQGQTISHDVMRFLLSSQKSNNSEYACRATAAKNTSRCTIHEFEKRSMAGAHRPISVNKYS